MKKNIVITGINLFEGGPLSVYKDCLDSIISSNFHKEMNITLFVHKNELFKQYFEYFSIIELPKSRKNYLFRFYYEYLYFKKYSKKNNVDIWLSLHDITPNVRAERIYTYCHNPSPFHKTSLTNIKYSFKTVLFAYLYKWIYKINIKNNSYVIVQQDWIRDQFIKMFKIKNIIVARPNFDNAITLGTHKENLDKFTFLYPVYPRYFKNFEVICKACDELERQGKSDFKVIFTIDGTENKYSKMIRKKYNHCKTIEWIGLQPRENIFSLYESTDCLLFSSVLETWGLPISEFKASKRTIIMSDLPYTHETLGNYEKSLFFNPNNPVELAKIMSDEIDGLSTYTQNFEKSIETPYFLNWDALLKFLFKY